MTSDSPSDAGPFGPFHDGVEVAQWFSHSARELAEVHGLDATLQRIVELVGKVVGVRLAALVGLDQRKLPKLLAATDPELAELIVAAQRSAGGGPAWQAMQDCATVLVDNLAEDNRWPGYAETILRDTPIRSVLAYCLMIDGQPLATLALYSEHPHAFGSREQLLAGIYADHAMIAFNEATEGDRAENLEAALATSRTIGTALGILIERHRVSTDEAFAMLRQVSQNLNRKLHDVAKDLVMGGDFPPSV